MNRKGLEYFMPVMTFLIVAVISIGAFMLFNNQFSNDEGPKISEKQEAIYQAEQRAHALETYAREVADIAVRDAEEEALNDPKTPYEDFALIHFKNYFIEYPLDNVKADIDASMTWENGKMAIRFYSRDNIEIPISVVNEKSTTGDFRTGVFDRWPVDLPVRVTSMFGYRDFESNQKDIYDGMNPSSNHGAIDIGIGPKGSPSADRIGKPVYAISDGTVTYKSGTTSLTLTTDKGWSCDYLHITPRPGINGSTVPKTYQIAEIAKYPPDKGGGEHLDLRCYTDLVLSKPKAEALFGTTHVSGSGATYDPPAADTTYAVSAFLGTTLRVYMDPYCLFDEYFREQIENSIIEGKLTGLKYREGATDQDKIWSTCQEYIDKGILPEEREEQEFVALDAIYETTIEKLNTLPTTGRKYMQSILDYNRLEPSVVIAFIAAETHGLIGEHLSISRYTTGVYQLMRIYDGYTHQLPFAAAHFYNDYFFSAGGNALITQYWDKPGPTFDDAMERYPALATKDVPASEAYIRNRIQEPIRFAKEVVRYNQMGGGASVPFGLGANRFGTLSYKLDITAPLSEVYQRVENIRKELAACKNDDPFLGCIGNIVSRRYPEAGGQLISDCTPYDEKLKRNIEECAAAMSQHNCTCRYLLPGLEMDIIVEEVHFFEDRIEVKGKKMTDAGATDDYENKLLVWWIDQEHNNLREVKFKAEGDDHEVSETSWRYSDPLHLRIVRKPFDSDLLDFFQTDVLLPLIDEAFWAVKKEESDKIIIEFYPEQPYDIDVCDINTHKRYCYQVGEDNRSFWVPHNLDVPLRRNTPPPLNCVCDNWMENSCQVGICKEAHQMLISRNCTGDPGCDMQYDCIDYHPTCTGLQPPPDPYVPP